MPANIRDVPTKKFKSNWLLSKKYDTSEPNISVRERYILNAIWKGILDFALDCQKYIPIRFKTIP